MTLAVAAIACLISEVDRVKRVLCARKGFMWSPRRVTELLVRVPWSGSRAVEMFGLDKLFNKFEPPRAIHSVRRR